MIYGVKRTKYTVDINKQKLGPTPCLKKNCASVIF